MSIVFVRSKPYKIRGLCGGDFFAADQRRMPGMKEKLRSINIAFGQFLTRIGIGMRAKLIIIFLIVKVVPLILLTLFAWRQINVLGDTLRQIAGEDASKALNDGAIENIERMTTDTAQEVAEFLYGRDADILYLASIEPNAENYRHFVEGKTARLMTNGE